MTQHTVTIQGDEIWFDGERVAVIAPGLSATTRARLSVAIDGAEVFTEGATNRGSYAMTYRRREYPGRSI